jgi:glycosyltransferase involved in cell wall biosynthesis
LVVYGIHSIDRVWYSNCVGIVSARFTQLLMRSFKSPPVEYPLGAVAIIGPQPPPLGGMALQAQALCQHLTAESIAVHWVHTNPRLPSLFTHVWGVRTLCQSAVYVVRLVRALPQATVVHIFAASYVYFFIRVAPAVVSARLMGKHVVLNYRGGAGPDFFARFGWIALPIVRLADLITVPSAYLERCFLAAGVSCRIVPNLVDLQRFHFRRRDLLRPNILVNRNFEPMYNVGMALRAFEIIKQDYPAARLDVVGSGAQENELKAWVAAHKLVDVVFHGAVTNQLMAKFLDQADILLNPTTVDNLPMSLLEAFASGVAVVSTDVGGIPDLVGHGEAAILVRSDDHRQMAAEVQRLLADPQLASRLIAAGRRLTEKFDWPAVRQGLLDAYCAKGPRSDLNGVTVSEKP